MNAENVLHYVKHGDQRCDKCIRGFNEYWLKRSVRSKSTQKVGTND